MPFGLVNATSTFQRLMDGSWRVCMPFGLVNATSTSQRFMDRVLEDTHTFWSS